MSNYSELLRDPRWQKKRLLIMARDEWKCYLCHREGETLNVHHLKYSGAPWETDDAYLITLCEDCHKMEERYKQENPFLRVLSNKSYILATVLVDSTIVTAYHLKKQIKTYADIREEIKQKDKDIQKMLTNG